MTGGGEAPARRPYLLTDSGMAEASAAHAVVQRHEDAALRRLAEERDIW